MPTTKWIRGTAVVATAVLLSTAFGSVANSAPRPQRPPQIIGDGAAALPDKDVRPGRAGPTQQQRAQAGEATVRWNAFGTPATLTEQGTPLATGLPANPEQAARAYLKSHADVFGLSASSLDSLETVAVNPLGKGAAVLLRQRFGNLPAGHDGLVALGVTDGKVVSVTSTLARDTDAPAPATLTSEQAVTAAARDAGMDAAAATARRARLVAVPTAQGARSAYEVTLINGAEAAAVTSFVDARSGEVLIRENLVDHDTDNPRWAVFPATPSADYSSTDTRQTWCFAPATGCDFVAGGDAAAGRPWDVDHTTGLPTNTSLGNAARTFENRDNGDPRTVGTRPNAPKADRNYIYPWTNQWFEAKCDPATFASPQEADLEAAISNLFVGHNRMHDWAYRLGFTETAWNMQSDNGTRGGLGGDPELGNAQAGARGEPEQRDNANQITPPEGMPTITNMYVWQPIAGAFYAPCVDGDFDMTVIGHEYTHAISGRMVGGPDVGWNGAQPGAMNESTSDLFAMEMLNEFGFRPPGNSPFVIGAYVTGDPGAGIRNYDMSKSPLNYSDIAYDLVGQQVHADGEIWSATQFDIRNAFIQRYGKGSASLQRRCAQGQVPVTSCPGNRRWAQLAFDALLLMASGAVSYVDHRDALLAADTIRFGGANQDIMWREFARHGLGSGAFSADQNAADPTPSFQSPTGANATVTFRPSGEARGASVRLYVGDYEARAVPVADTDPATTLGATFRMVPGKYSFVAVGAGFGHKRFTADIRAGNRTLDPALARNLAAAANGATAAGDGVNQARLVDETEATNWASLTAPVAGRQVTVDLAGDAPATVRRVQVSALLRPDIQDPADPGGQNRFSALRQFRVLACDAASGADCADSASYRAVFTSPAGAFPSGMPRPRAPELIMRSFSIPATTATHLRLEVVSSQCTGNPAYAGEQDADPRSTTDCATGSAAAGQVRAAEFQAYTR
ncbi:MAG TPA: M36 family metallopeptidase [Streptosporangiaceae bacterium]|nr:M36 family metallopeptidase [Streptosporangiaceae bacterium]